MGFNLTNEEIQNTYQQLVQINGTTLVDGTGSAIPVIDNITVVSASYATSASYADTVGNIDTASLVNQTQFNDYTSSVAFSTSASFSDVETQIASLEAGSGSADWTLITNKPVGLVSGSAQSIANVSNKNLSNVTASNISIVGDANNSILVGTTNPIRILGQPDFITSFEAKGIHDVGALQGIVGPISSSYMELSADGSHIFRINSKQGLGGIDLASNGFRSAQFYASGTNEGYVDFRVPITSSNALISSNLNVGGNLTVNGTGSFGYIQSVTGSAKIVGDAFIILNNDTPTLRYAGVKVQDSGSTNTTASIQWDGGTDDWFVEKDVSGTTEFGVVTLGPEYTTIGTPTYNTNNTLVMSNGGHHLNDSPVSVSASVVTVTGVVSASSYIGDGSGLTGISTIIQEGEGGLSIKSVLGSSQTTNGVYSLGLVGGGTASGDRAIKIGENGSANGQNAIAIGKNAYANGLNSIAIGRGGAGDEDLSAPNANQINIGNQIKTGGGQSTRLSDWTGSLHATSTLIGRTDNTTSLVNVLGENNVQIGYNSRIVESSTRSNVTSVGANNIAAQGCIILGNTTTGNGDSVIAIGNSLTVASNNEISIGDKFKYDGSDTIQLNSTNLLFNNNGTIGAGKVAINMGIEGGSVTGDYSTVIGATYSTISADNCFIAGGYNHSITAGSNNAIVGAGENCNILSNANYSSILGGSSNTITGGDTSFILGGYQNQVTNGLRNGVVGGNAAVSAHDFSVVIGRESFTSTAAYTTYVANLETSGSVEVNGQINSPTFAGTIASSTSSIDFNKGNFATLNASTATFVANPTNLKSGTTYTVIVTNGANISGYGTAWKFAGGTEPTFSANTDILTCVSDGTSLYATGLADFS